LTFYESIISYIAFGIYFLTHHAGILLSLLSHPRWDISIIDGTIRFNNAKIQTQTHALGSICVRRDGI